MKIVFLEWNSFGSNDILDAFHALKHEVIRIPFSNKTGRSDAAFEASFAEALRKHTPDYVFSFNYFPAVSLVCKKADIPYLAWVYDSPYVQLYSYTVIFPCNRIFVFDKEQCLEFNRAGIPTVHYLPMAANTKRLDAMLDFDAFSQTGLKPQTDLAFIGSMYTETHQFYDRLTGITPYTRGYLEGIMAAQKHVYGYHFIEEVLSPGIIADMQKYLPLEPNADGVETLEYLFAQYVISRRITGEERMELLRAIGERHPIDLYTPDRNLKLPGAVNHGTADYYNTAPYIFKTAKINLNISLRSIKSGIPLRAFDILGAGGFLLSNFQSDFLDLFVPDEDFVYFESRQDMLDKISYYLSHEEERKAIAKSGHDKTASAHTYVHRIEEMEAVGLC